MLKTGRYNLTNLPYDVRFCDELSGVYVHVVGRRSEDSLLQGIVMLKARVNMANFLRHCISWYCTIP